MNGRFSKIAFTSSSAPSAQRSHALLAKRYGDVPPEEADVIVALGGDGLILETLHRVMAHSTPVYGMNRGSVGFLMNEYREDALYERLEASEETITHPLRMTAVDRAGKQVDALAINEVSLLRATPQASKIQISVDGSIRLEELICDGVLVATPAGSTAFRPRLWRGALLSHQAVVRFDVLESDKRPVSAVADAVEVRNPEWVEARIADDVNLRLLFDPGHSLDERILREQFAS